MPRMMTYSVSQPDLYAEYFERVIMPRRQWLRSGAASDGIERGELRADLDVEIAAMALIGPAAAARPQPRHRRSADSAST